MDKKTPDFSFQDAMRLAQSDGGRQLQALLQQTDPELLNTAQTQVAEGNYDQLKKTLSSLLASEDVRRLLGQIGGSHNG